MMVTLFVGLAMVAGMTLILWNGYREIERSRRDEGTADAVHAPVHSWTPTQTPDGCCVLCGAPLRREITPSEVVTEVERRIDSELAAAARFLAEPRPDRLMQLN